MSTFLVAIASIFMSVMAQFALKAGMSGDAVKTALAAPFGPATVVRILSDKFVFLGFALYGLGAMVWLVVLSRWDVSKAYPLVGLGFVITAVIAWFAGEDVTALRLGGIALICAGVLCISAS